jgi:hypothetical protein
VHRGRESLSISQKTVELGNKYSVEQMRRCGEEVR